MSLLAANLFGQETGASSLGLNTDQNEIVLFRRLGVEETDYQAFVSALEEFVNCLEELTEKAASLAQGTAEALKPIDQPPRPGTMIRA